MTLIYNDNQSAGNSAKPPVTLRMLLPLWNFPCTPLLTELLPLLSLGFPDSSVSKESSFSAGDQGSIPDQEDSLEKETATHASILAWRIPWTEEPGRLQSMGSQRVGHDWATFTSLSLVRTSSRALTTPIHPLSALTGQETVPNAGRRVRINIYRRDEDLGSPGYILGLKHQERDFLSSRKTTRRCYVFLRQGN